MRGEMFKMLAFQSNAASEPWNLDFRQVRLRFHSRLLVSL
jgi:hypothetical protein